MKIDELIIKSLMSFARQHPSAKGRNVELEFTLDESGQRVCFMHVVLPRGPVENWPFYETKI